MQGITYIFCFKTSSVKIREPTSTLVIGSRIDVPVCLTLHHILCDRKTREKGSTSQEYARPAGSIRSGTAVQSMYIERRMVQSRLNIATTTRAPTSCLFPKERLACFASRVSKEEHTGHNLQKRRRAQPTNRQDNAIHSKQRQPPVQPKTETQFCFIPRRNYGKINAAESDANHPPTRKASNHFNSRST